MRSHPHFIPYLALAAVCFFWGTTYLAIRMALEAFPPVMVVCFRYLAAGLALVIALKWNGSKFPTGPALWKTALYGLITIGISNFCVTWCEQWLPSGLVALFVVTSPFWMVGIEAFLPGGDRLHFPTICGLLLGLAGTALLVNNGPVEGAKGGGNALFGFMVLQLGCLAWAAGSLAQRRLDTSTHPAVNGAVQQLAVGIAYIIPSLAIRQTPLHLTTRSVVALIYLIVFGSMVGYTAYIYAMDKLPVSLVSIHIYLNPLVAVWLGWLFYNEPFGTREALAMAIICAGVYVVKRASLSRAPSRPELRPLPEAE